MSSSLMPSVYCSFSKLAGCCSIVLVLLLLVVGDLSDAFYILENPETPFGGRAIAVRGKRNFPAIALEEPQQSAFLVEWVEPGEMPPMRQNQPIQLQIDQDGVGNDGREQVYVIEEPETDDQKQLVLVPEGRQPNGLRYQIGMDGGRLMKRSLPEQMDQSAWLAYPPNQATQEEESTEAMLDQLLLRMAEEVEAERQESEKSEALQRLIVEAMYQQKAQQMQADQMDYLQRAQQLKESLRSKRSQPATDLSTAYELANEYGQALLPEDIEGAFQLSNGQPIEFLMPTAADWDKSNDDRFQMARGKRGSPSGYQLVIIP